MIPKINDQELEQYKFGSLKGHADGEWDFGEKGLITPAWSGVNAIHLYTIIVIFNFKSYLFRIELKHQFGQSDLISFL